GGGARVRRAAARRARALADDPQAQVLGPPHAHRRRRSHGRRARWARPHRPGGLRRGVRPAAGGPARPTRGELMLTELATFSDRLFVAAAGIYALAMIFHAVEFAAARAKSPALVGAGAPAEESTRTRPERFGRMAVAVTVLGAALHLVSLATRGLAAERWPMGNMYEFISAICLAAVVTWLVVLRRSPSARPAGPFVLFPVLVLMALAGSVLYVPTGPVVPPLRSYWMSIHVSTISVSS